MIRTILSIPRDVKNKDEILAQLSAVRENFELLNKKQSKHLHKRVMSYHFLQFDKGLRDIKIILNRLFDNSGQLIKIDKEFEKHKPQNWPSNTSYPHNVQEIMKKEGLCADELRFDFESLFVFTGILLDHWSMYLAHLFNLEKPEKITFSELIKGFEENKYPENLTELWNIYYKEMLVIYHHINVYRNKFIVHNEGPYQIGYSRDIGRERFYISLSFLYSPEYHQELEGEIKRLIALFPDRLAKCFARCLETMSMPVVLSYMFDCIGEIKKTNRDKLRKIVKKIGFYTPTYQVNVYRLLNLLQKVLKRLCK